MKRCCRCFSGAAFLSADRIVSGSAEIFQVRESERRAQVFTQFDPKVVEVFMSIPEEHWAELRENLGSPFRLAHLKNLS